MLHMVAYWPVLINWGPLRAEQFMDEQYLVFTSQHIMHNTDILMQAAPFYTRKIRKVTDCQWLKIEIQE